MDVMHVHDTLDSTMKQMESMMQSSLQSGLAGQGLDDAQRKIIESGQAKTRNLLMDALAWNKIEPIYMDIYRKSFSQKEIDDMLAFYKSPSGQAVIAKLPVVMQQSMQFVRTELSALAPDIQKISNETVSELRTYNASKTRPASSP
jgi:hypothetical protein